MVWEALYAIGTLLLALAAIPAGIWAIYSHRSRRRADAAKWMRELYTDFYSDPEILKYRRYMEYPALADRLAPVLLLRVADRDVDLTEEEQRTIEGLDKVLNFLEQLIYLEQSGHVKRTDLNVFFQYWFEILQAPHNASLRQYLVHCGYERCGGDVSATPAAHIVVPESSVGERSSPRYTFSPGEVIPCGDGMGGLRDVQEAIGYDPDRRDDQYWKRRIIDAEVEGRSVPAWGFLR